MPTSYSIIPDPGYIRIELSGPVQLRDIISVLQSVTEDARYVPGFHFLFDVRAITQYLSYAETISLYEFFQSYFIKTIKGKVAVVITLKVQYGITRIAGTIFSRKGIIVEAFYTEEEALRWFAESVPVAAGTSGTSL